MVRLGCTFEDDGNAVAVINESGKSSQIIVFGESLIGDLDESDAQLVGLVVDVLQLAEDLLALLVERLVCSTDMESIHGHLNTWIELIELQKQTAT